MEALLDMLPGIPISVLAVIVQYRLASKVLGNRYAWQPTIFLLMVSHFLSGWMNLQFHIAGDMGNIFYYLCIDFALYLLLFKGDCAKKLFLGVILSCGLSIAYYISMPFASYFLGQDSPRFIPALNTLGIINNLLYFVTIEYMGKKLQNLRHKLPTGYTIYLSAVILFVYVAIYAAYDSLLMSKSGVVSLPAALAISSFAVAGVAITMVAIFAVDRQVARLLQEKLQSLQAENFKSRQLEWGKVAGFRHDIKNHLLCLNSLLEQGKTAQALAYMRNLSDVVQEFENPVQTGNDYADALLSVKYAQAVAANIKVTMEMAIPPQGYIEPVDLCCILSNAFDNAIAACMHLPEDARWITARAFIKQGQFVIAIENSKPENIRVVDGQVFPKESGPDHGIGLDTVKGVVEKYGGTLGLSAKDRFSFSVLLP